MRIGGLVVAQDQPSENGLEKDEIDVTPTKAFFVDMLTKDVGLDRAIIDLVDNSIDGARRLRPGRDESLAGLEVKISAKPERFEITDNCGGIGIELAKKYAFRIGRPKEMPSTPGSVGQFGIGMKRALFKLGREFRVTSTTAQDHFVVDQNVDKWMEEEKSWRFHFSKAESGLNNPQADIGTKIEVWELRDSVKQSFAALWSLTSLHSAIQSAQQNYIDRGLSILLNNRAMLSSDIRLLVSPHLAPARVEEEFDIASNVPIHVAIYAGIAESDPRRAGWYVFCNGRLVVEADQTKRTGWERSIETARAPKYHNQFARFRGYVYFNSEDAAKLPWNTTKTGVDEDSQVYQRVRDKMVAAMRPVIDFLNELDGEQQLPEGDRQLEKLVARAIPVELKKVQHAGTAFRFTIPPPPIDQPNFTTIVFKRPEKKIDELRDALGAGSAKAVGERAFDIVYRDLIEKNK
jgi:hypothetical protein